SVMNTELPKPQYSLLLFVIHCSRSCCHCSIQYCYYAGIAIHAQALAVFDALGSVARAYHRGHAIFTRHNSHVRHCAADIRYGRFYLAEQRPPAWMGDWTHQNIAFLDFAEIRNAAQYTRDALD